jgi:hypothetical protein
MKQYDGMGNEQEKADNMPLMDEPEDNRVIGNVQGLVDEAE